LPNESHKRPEERPRAVVITGPTASGKTHLAVELARVLDGEIVNADSMQVYKGMDVGTAKLRPEEQKGVPHHLFDVVNPDEEFNASIYRQRALPVIRDIVSRGKACFVAGGTGLYIRSLLSGLFDCPPVDREFREALEYEWEMYGAGYLYERLERLDPEAANKIHPNDRIRVVRALEIIHLANRRVSDLRKEHSFGDRPLNALKLCLEVEREKLYRRIKERSMAMVETGLVQETQDLLKRGYSPELKPMNAIGYRHIVKYLKGDWSLEEASLNLQRDTRRYAKRQLTWFRKEPGFTWVDPEDFEFILEKIRNFLCESS
jgi:tRNA dimethylallyltransferase